uniref:non-specific serine/threonine protein kinase n=1 Tax=Oryza nivara TaxID=4536 RepID=A0A0E0G571_ORYNI
MQHMVKPVCILCLQCSLLYGVHLAAAVASAGDGNGGDQFAYSGFAGVKDLTLDGTAMVTPDGLLELTNGKPQVKGHAFHPTPLRFEESSSPEGGEKKAAVRSFSASFVFGIVTASPGVGGHGIALVITPTKDLSSGLASTYLGFLNRSSNGDNRNHIFAVELDTIQSPEFSDIDDNHVGIDINSLVSSNASDAGYYDDNTGEFKSLTLVSGKAMQVWVDYDDDATQIDVRLAPVGIKKPMKPLVSTRFNLSTVITDEAYVGFSASIGTMTSQHYVLGWSFGVGTQAPAIDMDKLSRLPGTGRRSKKSYRPKTIVIALPIVSVVLVIAVAAGVFLLIKRKFQRYVELREDWELEFGAHRLSYKDLLQATERFNNKNLLGIGGFGRVYKGVLPTSSSEVAVKRVSHDSRQGIKEFVAEVASIGRLRHRNLVQLFGYCRLKEELLLVYDYMPNGSLDKYLYSHDDKPTLNWAQRFQIIKGIASGLLYLHEEWEQIVIHRDIKPSNVLLDNDMNGRLGDFGLARLYNRDTELQTTVVAGTFGYMAPELALTGKASPLTDVFAFGAFLLEVTSGRRPVEQDIEGHRLLLTDWVFENCSKEQILAVIDPRLNGNINISEASLVLKLGLLCSHPMSNVRPTMRQVVQYLNGDMPLPEMSPMRFTFSLSALMQNQGFDSLLKSLGTISTLSIGR